MSPSTSIGRRSRTGVLTALLGCHGGPVAAPFPVVDDPGGCRLERITDAGADDGHFQYHGPSPDGNRLVVGWYRGQETGSYLLDLVTRERRDLAGFNNGGAFSRDGRRILVANIQPDRNRELVELDLASGSTRIIASHPSPEFLGSWSPDGRTVLFNSYRTGRSDLYLVGPDGAPRRLTTFDGYDAHGDWSPDGRRILFNRELAPKDYDVVLLDLDSNEERPFAAGPGEQAYPAWSPDGRWVAFASDSGNPVGELDVFVTTPARDRTVRITRYPPGHNGYPAWSADGRWLYFNSNRAGKVNVFRTRIDLCIAGSASRRP